MLSKSRAGLGASGTGPAHPHARHSSFDDCLREQHPQEVAARTESLDRSVKELIQFILTGVEMLEMDGYVLTENIKMDA